MRILFLFLFLTSCATIKVKENGRDLVNIKPPKPKFPQKIGKNYIGGKIYPNPEVWVKKNGKYFYYKENSWPIKNRKIKLKVVN